MKEEDEEKMRKLKGINGFIFIFYQLANLLQLKNKKF